MIGEQRDHEKERNAFFADLENFLGEPIQSSVLAECVSGLESPGPVWGILTVSESYLFYTYSKSENWFSKLFKSSQFGSNGEADPKGIKLTWDQIRKIKDESPVSFLGRLLAPPLIPLRIEYTETTGDLKILRLQFEKKHREIVSLCSQKIESL